MRITRKMRRELKNAVNPLEELLIIIKQYFPKLTSWIDNLTDTRHKSYITYDFKICLLTQILAFCSSYQSMNKIGRDFNSDIVIDNINNILKTNYIELPHKDTLINVISEIKFEELECIQTNIIRTLIRSKMLDKYRFNGLFHIVIDGTGLYSTKVNLGEQAITKVYNKGEDNEYTLYSYYALEAKLVCGNMTLDDATDEILSGWFMPTECQLGYCYAFKIMFEKHGLPQTIYSDRTTILWNPKNGELTQVGRMLDELGIELIYANTPQAKGKIENKNKVVQNRLLNDIKRFNIKTYDELNKWFNDYYIDYLNKKFSYPPLEEETDFISLDNTDLSTIMCIKVDRKILNGNMISINNNYYIPINSDGSDFVFYKGTTVEVWQDVFTNDIRIFKNNKIYNTRKVKGHRVDMEKKVQKIIEEQKQLEVLLRERDERLKARAKHS